MSAIIFDTKTLTPICSYPSLDEARRRLTNAIEKGHKLRGRKYSRDWAERMDAVDADYYNESIDHDVEVINMMSGKPVTIKASQRGNPVYDVSMDSYWSM